MPPSSAGCFLPAISVWRPISRRGTIIRPPVIPSPVLIARPAVIAVAPVAGKPAIHVRNAANTTIYVQGGSAPAPICSTTVGHEPVPLGFNVPTALQVRSWRDVLGMCRCRHGSYQHRRPGKQTHLLVNDTWLILASYNLLSLPKRSFRFNSSDQYCLTNFDKNRQIVRATDPKGSPRPTRCPWFATT